MMLIIPAAMIKVAVPILLVPLARADDVCATTSGDTICRTKLSPSTVAAIISTVAVLVLLGCALALFYRRRQLARDKAAVAADAYMIEASQMQMRGPPVLARRTTYSAPYDPRSAPPSKPQSAGVKTPLTTYGGLTYPFSSVRDPVFWSLEWAYRFHSLKAPCRARAPRSPVPI